jgi:hypothetical protein
MKKNEIMDYTVVAKKNQVPNLQPKGKYLRTYYCQISFAIYEYFSI